MSTNATHDDANLILRLYEIRREDTMRTARSWFAANFRPKTVEQVHHVAAPGTRENAFFRQVSSYFEMVASFITSGILNKELYFQSGGELLLTYLRLHPFLQAWRETTNNPDAYRNLEIVGQELLAWYDQKGPGVRDAIVSRLS